MAYLNFGYTWWGKKWLDALLRTDYSNRLPRGKRYARNGYVKSIQLSTKGTMAKVQGSRLYSVTLSLPAFTKKEQATILDIIINNPLYLSSLLNRKLPEQLYQEFEEKKVLLFPKRWLDVKANCSCPDWAACCKHIAAVIYIIANEIDKNPFLVFDLHGFDIFAELKKKGFVLAEGEQQDIKHINQWLETNAPKNKENWSVDWPKINALDFTDIPFLQDQLLSLLDDQPLFYPQQDFKKILQKIYKAVAKDAEKAHEIIGQGLTENALQKIQDVNIVFNDTLDETILLAMDHLKDKKISNKQLDRGELITALSQISVKELGHLPDNIIALHIIMRFALKLLRQGAFLPEIIAINNNAYRLRWLPALLNKSVHELFEQLLLCVLPTLITLQTKSLSSTRLKQDEALKLLISLFLEYFISECCYRTKQIQLQEDILRFFFTGDILESRRFEDQELPTTIALWLNKFYITHKAYIPMLKIEEKKDFEVSILVDNRKQPLDAPIPLKAVFSNPKYQNVALSLFKDLQLLEGYFPEIAKILATKGKESVVVSSKEFPAIIFKQLPILKMLGIPLLLPKGLENIVRPQVSLSASQKTGAKATGTSYLSLNDLLDFNWEIALGDQHIKLQEFKKLLKNSSGIVKIKDQYVYFDEKEIQKMLRNIDHEPRLSGAEKMRSILSGQYKGAKINMGKAVKNMLAKIHNIDKVPLPETLQAILRPYQLRGYEWLYKNTSFGFGSLIADDMGLGKTIQVIAYLLKIKADGRLKKHPALIVVPTTLLTNWQKEITKFATTLNVHIYHGAKRELALKGQDILITSYGLARRDISKFSQFKWPAVILDEAQNIKNHETAQTKAIKKIKADIRIAMTGTPVENRLSEYWSIIDFLNKGYLGGSEAFKKEFAIPIEVDRDQQSLDIFKKMTDPFILRRVKTDKRIIKDLPDKIEIDQFNQLSKPQIALYQSIVDNSLSQIENEEGINRRGLIFKLMTSLKQVCNHPAHFQKKKEIDPSLSGKTSALIGLLENIYENNEKVLIFTQYTEMGELLKTLIEETYSSEALFFHGGLTRKRRDEMVDRFQDDRTSNVLILSLKAGGTGLNLTAAKHVIHFDLWWNPAVEAQATDRAYRIGQKENIMVYRMITKDTFEEKINDMLRQKKELADLTVNNGEKWIGEFSNQELKDIFKLGLPADYEP